MTHLDTLKRHQAWRRGSDDTMQDPTEIGIAIDYAIAVCEAARELVEVKGRHHTESLSPLYLSELSYARLVDAVKGA